MNIVVCVKRVPDTATRIQIAASGTSIDPANIEYITSPYDEFALEMGLRLKDKHGGTVTALSLGPAEAAKELRDCLAKGADKALLLKADSTGRDPFTTSRALADALVPLAPDLVLFGYKAVDDDAAQVGSMVATLLDLPAATEVVEVEVADGKARAHREAEGGHETVELSLPACLTVQKGPHEPRIASLKGIMAAKKKPLEEKPAALAEPRLTARKLAFPAQRPAGRLLKGGAEAVPEVVKYLKQELKLL